MTAIEIMGMNAKKAARVLAKAETGLKNRALEAMAQALLDGAAQIIEANDIDIAQGQANGMSVSLQDRLRLTEARIAGMADGIRQVASLDDPVGKVLSTHIREDGLEINKVSSAIGVVAIIYESRPNVTSDAAALALKSGNACVLRCGKEAHKSALAITEAIGDGLENAGFPRDCVKLVEDTTRESARELMCANGYVDLLIPRGGPGLIRACIENATVPCIETGTGICHIYVDKTADLDMALKIVNNAKTSRPSVCNAAEVCLIHRDIVKEFVAMLEAELVENRKKSGVAPVVFKMDDDSIIFSKYGVAAEENDFDTEFLDYKMAIKTVESVSDAVSHISVHSTGHSESIISNDSQSIDYFTKNVDSAAVYVNASTRFTDGGEFGLGCEMGISTQKLHARGPMGLGELTTYKYIIKGNGNIR